MHFVREEIHNFLNDNFDNNNNNLVSKLPSDQKHCLF